MVETGGGAAGGEEFTAADALVVEHHSLVAAELVFLHGDDARHHGGVRNRKKHLSQEGARRAELLEQLHTHARTNEKIMRFSILKKTMFEMCT